MFLVQELCATSLSVGLQRKVLYSRSTGQPDMVRVRKETRTACWVMFSWWASTHPSCQHSSVEQTGWNSTPLAGAAPALMPIPTPC